MKVFEFHFNPRIKSDLTFDSFCYEPQSVYEKKMGNLYMIGLLKKPLPKNINLVKTLAKTIKEKYFDSKIISPEKSLKQSLKTANNFLEGLTEKGDVSWLGNLSFSILSLKDFKLNFTKVGDVKVLLIRDGQITDIDKKINNQDIEPYPLKIFNNTIYGKLAENDLILVLSKDILNFLRAEDMLRQVAQLDSFNEKDFKEILDKKQKKLSNISGIALAMLLTKDFVSGKRRTISSKDLKEFSIKEMIAPLLTAFEKIKTFQIAIPKTTSLAKIKTSLPKINSFSLDSKTFLIFGFIFILAIGSIFFRAKEKGEIKNYSQELQEIQEKFNTANSFLILEEANPESIRKANSLLKESWDRISSLTKETISLSRDFNGQVSSLENEIVEKLSELNGLEEIESPEPFFEFERTFFIPHKILSFNKDIYFFSPYAKNIFKLEEDKQSEIIETEQNIDSATTFNDSISFFSKPNRLIVFKGYITHSSLKTSNSDFNFNDFSSFNKNLYFFDKKTGEIIKYPYVGSLKWGSPTSWLNTKTQKTAGAESFAVDGSVWVLDENSIYKYYAGSFQEELNLEIFPIPNSFSKILTSPTLSYLYILEPVQKRIIVLDKSGKIIKQFHSENFDNLLDFSVSENGKTIYLLNGLKVYKIEF